MYLITFVYFVICWTEKNTMLFVYLKYLNTLLKYIILNVILFSNFTHFIPRFKLQKKTWITISLITVFE